MNASQDWEDISVGDLGEIVAGGTPDRTNPSYWGGPIPWVTPSEITELKGKYIRETEEYITEAGLAGSAARLLPLGTVLVTTRATLGETAIAGVPLTTNQGFKNVVPAKETDSLYAYYLLRILKPEMIRLSSGTTFLEISKFEFARIKTRRPQIDEQRRITAVLDTLDETILKTEAVIAKLRQMRAGLLNDLLTCGLDKNGELRNPMIYPNRFKESSLGLIPEEWDEKSIDEAAFVTKLAGFEFTNFVRYSEEGEIIALRALNIKDERLDLSDVQRIPKVVSDTLLRSKVFSGDIVITYIGAYIGDVLLIQENDRFHLAPNICKVTARGEVSPDFLQWQLRSSNTKSQIRKLITTTATPSLTMTQIRRLKVAIPKNSLEQDQIVAAIVSLDTVIRKEELFRNKLCQIRKSLMQDLLTGRVRVPEGII